MTAGPVQLTVTTGVDCRRISYSEKYGFNSPVPTLNIFCPAYSVTWPSWLAAVYLFDN